MIYKYRYTYKPCESAVIVNLQVFADPWPMEEWPRGGAPK